VLTKHIQAADLIVTTAAIPGKASPKLISHAQVAGMKAGAVIVDLSAEGGGNCEDTQPGETALVGRVTIVAPLNMPSLLGEDASELYAKNQYNLLALMMKENVIEIDWSDEILAKTVLTHAGENMAAASDKAAIAAPLHAKAVPARPAAATPTAA
jgi:NAD(P) transhydrogenase subunit alpha